MNVFVDDMCIAEAVGYNHILQINTCVNNINERLSCNKMCLNAKKSNVIIIDNSKGKRFSNTSIL